MKFPNGTQVRSAIVCVGRAHAYEAVRAAVEGGYDTRFITGYYRGRSKFLDAITHIGVGARADARADSAIALQNVCVLPAGDVVHGMLRVVGLHRQCVHWRDELFSRGAAQATRKAHLIHAWKGHAKYILRQNRDATVLLDFANVHPRDHRAVLMENSQKIEVGLRRVMSNWEEELRLATDVVVPSELVRDSLVRNGYGGRVWTAPLGVDSVAFRPLRASASPSQRSTLLYVGTVSRTKGTHVLVGALRMLRKYREVRLIVAGEIGDPTLGRELLSLPNVEYKGLVGRRELPSLYNSAGVFVLPSLCDAYPMALMEALACGLPCVASDMVGGPMEDNKHVVRCRASSVESLAASISRVLEDPIVAGALATSGVELARTLTWDAYRLRIQQTYAAAMRASMR